MTTGNTLPLPSIPRRDEPVRLGLLYPTPDCGEDDYPEYARTLHEATEIHVAYVPWGGERPALEDRDAVGKLAAVKELGELDRLSTTAATLRGTPLDAVTWACSSASFLWGLEGSHRQAGALRGVLGVPASNTSVAFLNALAELRVTQVAIASVYPSLITDQFIAYLAEAGVRTVSRVDMDASSDLELARWNPTQITDMVRAADSPAAEAVLVPETALHTAHLLGRLEASVGKTVLTATQVTIWDAFRTALQPEQPSAPADEHGCPCHDRRGGSPTSVSQPTRPPTLAYPRTTPMRLPPRDQSGRRSGSGRCAQSC